ncbi:MAG: hypothetical protein AAF694_18780 [Bacteroidota bacterium]
MISFEEHTLRDHQIRASFYKKLAEIRSIQRKNTFLDYAVNEHLFDELLAIYEENRKQYEVYYLKNIKDYQRVVPEVEAQKDKMHQARFAEILILRKQIEESLQSETYEENRKAADYIQELTRKTEVYRVEMLQWQSELYETAQLIDQAKGKIWEEDIATFKQAHQSLKAAIFSDQLPQVSLENIPQEVEKAQTARTHAFQELLQRVKPFPKLQKRMLTIQRSELSRTVFEQLQDGTETARKLRGWVLGSAGAFALIFIAFVALEAPGWIFRYLTRQDWEAAQELNSYEGYQDFIDRYQEGSYVIAAKEAQSQLKTGKITAYNEPNYGEFSYEGDLKDGKPEGKGKAVFRTGARYEGEWVAGKFEGKGRWTSASQESYEGNWIAGKKQGQGTFTFSDGSRYEGSWEDNNPQGKGTRYLANKAVYEGNWAKGKLEGQGKWEDGNGNHYQGNWNNGVFHGKGTYTYTDGGQYQGSWRAGKRSGEGMFSWKNGKNYSGKWEDDAMHGKGVLRWENGAVFVGNWRKGLLDGAGSFTSRLRETYEGTFVQDSTGIITLFGASDQVIRRGSFQEGLFVTGVSGDRGE